MNLTIPKGWVETTREHFEHLLTYRNYFRDGWANGERYHEVHSKEPFAIHTTDDRYFVKASGP